MIYKTIELYLQDSDHLRRPAYDVVFRHGLRHPSLLASLTIGFCASLFALLCGVWAALALRQYGVKTQKWLSMVF
ncbi:hypothetical protein MJM04_29810, partial [Salmonella enterica subsp. enterica serovar Cerro]|nr:hypothetical protein [Salmonella enterica subsp. enterica serovar Cerro]